jgi:hypothetical protein
LGQTFPFTYNHYPKNSPRLSSPDFLARGPLGPASIIFHKGREKIKISLMTLQNWLLTENKNYDKVAQIQTI